MMRASSWRKSAGLLTLITALGSVSLGSARAADIAEPAPTWAESEPAPLTPRRYAGAAPLSPETVLVFGGSSGSGGFVARVPVATGSSQPRDTAVLNVRTGNWTATSPLPDGITLLQPTLDRPINFDPEGSNGFAYALAKGGGLLRYDAAADRWDTLPLPPIGPIGALLAVDGRPIVLNFNPERPGKDPAGAVLDSAGRWRELPPLPSTTFGRTSSSWREAVWVGGRLVISTGLVVNKLIHLAALNLDRPGDGWKGLPTGRSQYPYLEGNAFPPVAVAGRIVWPMVVYDPATGRSTPTPAEIRDTLSQREGRDPVGAVPSMHILGDKITLAGYAFEPVTGKTTPIPLGPPRGLGGGASWVGGPSGILGFGGLQSNSTPTTTINTPTNNASRLLPDRES